MQVVGAHLRNEEHLRPSDRARVEDARFTGVVAFGYQHPEEVLALGVLPGRCVVRLEDSTHWGRVRGEDELYGIWRDELLKWKAAGFYRFQADNEPNLSWRGYTPPAGHTVAWVWAWLLRRVLKRLYVDGYLEGVSLLLTPMSHPEQTPEWLYMTSFSEHEYPSIAAYCREAAAHCYWQRAEHMDDGWAGGGYEYVRRITGMDVWVTECGNSSIQVPPGVTPPSLSEIEAEQARDYPLYVSQLSSASCVKGLFFFILGHSPEPGARWDGFDLTERVCRAIGARGEESRNTGGGRAAI